LVPLWGIASLALATPSWASWTTNGAPVAPSDSAQLSPVIAPAADGGAYIAWEDSSLGSPNTFLQRLMPDGATAPLWPMAGHQITTGGGRSNPVVIPDGAGGVYVADDATIGYRWGHEGLAHVEADGLVRFQGGLTGDPLGIPGGVHGDYLPALAPDDSGGVLMSWTYRDRLSDIAKLSRLHPDGSMAAGWNPHGNNPAGLYAEEPTAVCDDGAGGAFISWEYEFGYQVFIHHVSGAAYGSAGWPVCASLRTHHQAAIGLVPDGAGGVIVVWQDGRNGVFEQTYAQHFVASGAPAAGWDSGGVALSTFPTREGINRGLFGGYYWRVRYSSVVSDGAGGAFATWVDYRDSSATQGDIYAQHILGAGTLDPSWPANGLAVCASPHDQTLPAIAADGVGGALIAWQDARNGDGTDIYAARVTSAGTFAPGWPPNGLAACTASGAQESPVITNDGGSGAIIAWVDRRTGAPNVYAARVTRDGIVATLVSLVSTEALQDRVRIVWRVVGGAGQAAIVYRREVNGAWISRATVTADGEGRISFEDHTVVAGARYDYRVGFEKNGAEEFSGEISLQVPGAPSLALVGLTPSPAQPDVNVSFDLPSAAPATLELLDVAGRRVVSRQVGPLGPGHHVLNIPEARSLSAGLYILRLVQGDRSLTARASIIR
jgi:hypothetical protein